MDTVLNFSVECMELSSLLCQRELNGLNANAEFPIVFTGFQVFGKM